MTQLIDGKAIAKKIEISVKEELQALVGKAGFAPKLISLMVGRQKEAEIYIKMQEKAAGAIGIQLEVHEIEESISQTGLVEEIDKLNKDRAVTSIILQEPLPEGIDYSTVLSGILPEKDAEGMHPLNLGKLLTRQADIVPCTPEAIMRILHVKGVELYGREIVIVGHSAIVGKPLSLMMLNETATTTVCHIGTAEKGDIVSHTRRADVLVVAVGKPEMVRGSWVKKGAVVIDVGINDVDGKIVGDVNFPEAKERASMITPVPGGVGPVTVAILMRNVLHAFGKQHGQI